MGRKKGVRSGAEISEADQLILSALMVYVMYILVALVGFFI